MNWLRRQFNEILGLFFLSFGVTPTEEMKKQLGIASQKDSEAPKTEPQSKEEPRQDSPS